MPLFGKEIGREFIARPDTSKNDILYKWPDHNIRRWSQITVQADEVAVFFRDGQVQGTLPPGRATLDSSEIPFLGKLVDAATGGDLFLTEIYFVSTKEFTSLPFGGMVDNVVDPDTGIAVGLRVYGDYSLRVVEPQTLIITLVGTQGLQSNDDITNWMRDQLLKVFRTDVVAHIAAQKWPILGISAHNDEIEQQTVGRVQTNIQTYGVQIVRMGNFTITLKEEDEAILKNYRRDVSYTRLAGGFQQYAAGEALLGVGQGASQGGGVVPPALLGLGLGMGGQLGGVQNQAMGGGGGQAVQVRCPHCNALNPESARFCASCGQSLAVATQVECPSCHAENAAGAHFCASCGASLVAPAAAAATASPEPPQASAPPAPEAPSAGPEGTPPAAPPEPPA